MIVRIEDWIFDVDLHRNATLSFEQAQSHCTCGYCQNFYHGVDLEYPGIRSFLQQFGIEVFGPDELCPFEPTIYEVSYIVEGSIKKYGSIPLFIDDIPIFITEECDFSNERLAPYFVITIGLFSLKWYLDEPMCDVISPANEKECLDRMWTKLLKRAQREDFTC